MAAYHRSAEGSFISIRAYRQFFCSGCCDLSDMPREDRGAGFDPGISDHVFKTLCRSALSDGRSCRNDHGDTDRSAGMQGVSEKT